MAQILLRIYNLMYSRIIHITLLAVVFILAFSVSPSSALDVPSQYEQDLLQLINEARENPLAVASSLGMDADRILQDFPELEDILTNGLPPLSFNENLYAAAGAHTQDMLENNYYSHTSLDGRTCDDRIVEKGYDPVVTGESLGMLAFSNFIQPADAVTLIFENMFRDELDPARTERRNILASDLEEAGIGFGAGAFKIDGSIYNAYLTTCDFAAGALSEPFDCSVMELELLELINQARENPLIVATSLGMDSDRILQDFPELEDILIYGLPPLIFNEKLYAAADAHTQDMLENNYYSHNSLDGRTCDDRIVEKGYDPVVTGESLGMLAFSNFIQPAEAVTLIFENMFRDELDPARTERRNILDPDLKEIGIGFGSGSFKIGRSIYNAYLTTCDFATSAITVLEFELLELINQAREDPLAVAQSFGLDPDQIMEEIPELCDIMTEGLPPLTLNLNLYASAAAHASDMLENGYYSYTSLDGRTASDRIAESGYLPIVTGETIRLFATIDFMEPAEGTAILFEQMFRRELSANCAGRNILNPEFKEVGVRLAAGSPGMWDWDESSGLCSYNGCYTLLLVADFGTSNIQGVPYLKGRVYRDQDGNGLYSIGEGLAAIPISVERTDTAFYLYTNQAGGFVAGLESGPCRIIAVFDGEPMELWVKMGEENEGVEFKIEP